MELMQLSNMQKKVLALGLLALVLICTYVPFETVYSHKSTHAKAYTGYSFLWSPPNSVNACLKTFGMGVYGWETAESVIQRANRTCYARPIFSQIAMSAAAAIFITAASFIILGLLKRQSAPQRSNNAQNEKKYRSVAEMIRSELGESFPISSGGGTKADPLVVTEEVDYVSVEHSAAKNIFKQFGKDYRLKGQALLTQNGRKIDQLTFDVKPTGAADWSEECSIYFDITAGFARLGA